MIDRENKLDVLARIREMAPWIWDLNVTEHETLLHVAYVIGHSDGVCDAKEVVREYCKATTQ